MFEFPQIPDFRVDIREVLDDETLKAILKLYKEDGDSNTRIESHFPFQRSFSLSSSSGGRAEFKMDSYNRFVVEVIQFSKEKQGFGSRLITLLEEKARRAGCQAIVLESITTDAGYRLALKLGYIMIREPNFGLKIKSHTYLNKSYIKKFPGNASRYVVHVYSEE